jgi:hypothetical protein
MMDEVTSDDQAAAYLKLQDDVRRLIVDTMFKELQNYGSPLHSHIKATTLFSGDFETRVKEVIRNQMNKY